MNSINFGLCLSPEEPVSVRGLNHSKNETLVVQLNERIGLSSSDG